MFRKYYLFIQLLITSSLLFSSCQSEDILENVEEENRTLRASQLYEFEYTHMKEVWRWYHHASNTDKDHYYGFVSPAYSTNTQIKGKNYQFETQQFWIFEANAAKHYSYDFYPLYRFYSPSQKAHRLHTSPTLSGFQQEELLGYICKTQLPGTVPVKEYHNPLLNDYFYYTLAREDKYTEENSPNTKYVRTIGYAYNGIKSENEVERPKVSVKIHNYDKIPKLYHLGGYLSLYVENKNKPGQETELAYYINFKDNDWSTTNGEFTIGIPENLLIKRFVIAYSGIGYGGLDRELYPHELPLHYTGKFSDSPSVKERWSVSLERISDNKYSLEFDFFS